MNHEIDPEPNREITRFRQVAFVVVVSFVVTILLAANVSEFKAWLFEAMP